MTVPEPTACDCLAALDRVALKLDACLALLEPLPSLDQAEVDRMFAEAEAAMASWWAEVDAEGWW
jgi:hypothetical protein